MEAGYVRDEVVERGKKSKLSSDCEEAKSAEESTSKTTLKEWKSLYTDLIRNLYPKFHESDKSQRLLGKRRRGEEERREEFDGEPPMLKRKDGAREAAGITKYMKSQVGPASKEIKTVAEAEAILGKTDAVIFGFGAADSTIQQTLAKTAAKLREEYTFAYTSAEEVMTKLGHKEGVVMFRPKHLQSKFEDSAVVYSGSDSDKGALATWIGDNINGLCGHRTTDNAKDFKVGKDLSQQGDLV